METEYYEDGVNRLINEYYQTGHDRYIHAMRKGYSFLEKTSAMVDRVSKRYDEELEQSKTKGDKVISPFVRGLMAPAKVSRKSIVPIAFGNVMGSLKRYQGHIKFSNPLAVLTETADAYCISLGDILKMTYGPIFSEQFQLLPKLAKARNNDKDNSQSLE